MLVDGLFKKKYLVKSIKLCMVLYDVIIHFIHLGYTYMRGCLYQTPFFLFTGVPVVSVTYSAVWRFSEIRPLDCNNISLRLDNLKKELEKNFANRCHEINIIATVQFEYSFSSLTVYIDIFLNKTRTELN